MSVGAFGSGLAKAFADYTQSERERARRSEDQQLDEQMQLIKALADRPDINPALLGRALTDLTTLQQAKGSKRKSKGGKEGFLGATELPLSQFLQGLQDGTTPIIGRTSEAVPEPPVPTQVAGYGPAQMIPNAARDINHDLGNGTGFSAGFDGASVLAQPIPVPPAGMPVPSPGQGEKLASAARDVQTHKALGINPRRPAARQPLLRAPEELAEERGAGEGILYKSRLKGQRDAEVEALTELGATPEQIREAMLRKMMGSTPRPVPLQTQNYVDAQGQPFTVMFDPATGRYMDPQGTIMAIPPGSRRIGIGPIVQYQSFTDDYGNVTVVPLDRNSPGVIGGSSVPLPSGVRGRTSPEGPVVVVQDASGAPVPARAPRQGNDLTPMTVPAPPQPGQAPTTVPAVGYRPPTQGTLDAVNAAETGLTILNTLEKTWDPSYTGIIQGPLNQFNQKYNPLAEANPNFRTFQATWASARNELLRANAGLTQTLTEKANTEEQIMRLNDKDENFIPALKALRTQFTLKLDAMKRNAGMGVPYNGSTAVPPPPAVPGRGIKLKAPNGTVKEYVDPVMIEYLKGKGAVVVP